MVCGAIAESIDRIKKYFSVRQPSYRLYIITLRAKGYRLKTKCCKNGEKILYYVNG